MPDYDKLAEWSLRDLQEARHQLQRMVESPGWATFQGFVQRSQVGYLNEAMTPANTMDEVLGSEYRKGQYRGIILPFQAIPGWIEELNQAIQAKEHDNGRANDGTSTQ